MLRRRFTLIELLVVIAIIAILASMLLPSLRRAKDKAITTTCIGRTKQLGLCYAMYANGSDDVLPYQVVHSNGWLGQQNTGGRNDVLPVQLKKYYGEEESIWACAAGKNYSVKNQRRYVGRWVNAGVHRDGNGGKMTQKRILNPSACVTMSCGYRNRQEAPGMNFHSTLYWRPHWTAATGGSLNGGNGSFQSSRFGPHPGCVFLYSDGHGEHHFQSYWLLGNNTPRTSAIYNPFTAGR